MAAYNRQICSFNPRICKRCDIRIGGLIITTYSFNPRICKRCDTGYELPELRVHVSIHASVKDATNIFVINIVHYWFQSTHL